MPTVVPCVVPTVVPVLPDFLGTTMGYGVRERGRQGCGRAGKNVRLAAEEVEPELHQVALDQDLSAAPVLLPRQAGHPQDGVARVGVPLAWQAPLAGRLPRPAHELAQEPAGVRVACELHADVDLGMRAAPRTRTCSGGAWCNRHDDRRFGLAVVRVILGDRLVLDRAHRPDHGRSPFAGSGSFGGALHEAIMYA